MNNIEAYPLQWPPGRKRTQFTSRSRFDVTPGRARDELFHELKLLGARDIVVSTNVKLRQDGLPYAGLREPDDRGVAVYFKYRSSSSKPQIDVCFACDRWDQIKDNMRAIAKTIEALRGIERWGTGDMVEAAFTGFTALPAPSVMVTARPWWDVLGVSREAPAHSIDQAYRDLARVNHPDSGGDPEKMAELNRARDEAKKERGV